MVSTHIEADQQANSSDLRLKRGQDLHAFFYAVAFLQDWSIFNVYIE